MYTAPIGSTRGQSLQVPTRHHAKSWPLIRRKASCGCGRPSEHPPSTSREDADLHGNSREHGPIPSAGAAPRSHASPGLQACTPLQQHTCSQNHPQQQGDAGHWHWLSRAACFAVTTATTLGLLAGTASADFVAGPAAPVPGLWEQQQPLAAATAPLQRGQQRTVALAERIAEPASYDIADAAAASGWGSVGAAGLPTAFQPGGLQFTLDGPADLPGQPPNAAAPAPLGTRNPGGFRSGNSSPGLWAARTAGPTADGPWIRPVSTAPRARGETTSDPANRGVNAAGAVVSAGTDERAGVTRGSEPPAFNGNSSADLASETEDRLLEAARQVEARVEGVLGALASGVPQLMAGPEAEREAARSTAAAHALIQEVWEVVDSNYLDARATGFNRQRWAELRDAALALPYRDTPSAYRAVRDLLARGLSDPYCRFIGPQELDAMKKYDVSGVGLNLGTAAEYVIKTGNDLPAPRDPSAGEGVYVVGVSKGSTADVAGIRQGDELLAIQGESLASSTPFRAAGLISGAVQEEHDEADAAAGAEAAVGGGGGGGKASQAHQQQRRQQQQEKAKGGDVVRVKVRHVSGGEEEVSLVRPRRTLPSVVTTSLTRSAVQLPGGGRGEELVGTVRLAAFNARAQADVAAAIRQLEGSGATRLVLDLRDNRGGLVTEGLEVAKLFLEGDSPIVITERRDATPDTPTAPGPPLTSSPLLVLVNGHTASASEIVAGALKDNCRAVLAGSRTYGKGLIQSVYELSDGSGLVITVGKYLTPRGNDIDRYGIKPDYSSVPSNSQYDSTVKACKLTAPVAVPAAAPALTFSNR